MGSTERPQSICDSKFDSGPRVSFFSWRKLSSLRSQLGRQKEPTGTAPGIVLYCCGERVSENLPDTLYRQATQLESSYLLHNLGKVTNANSFDAVGLRLIPLCLLQPLDDCFLELSAAVSSRPGKGHLSLRLFTSQSLDFLKNLGRGWRICRSRPRGVY